MSSPIYKKFGEVFGWFMYARSRKGGGWTYYWKVGNNIVEELVN